MNGSAFEKDLEEEVSLLREHARGYASQNRPPLRPSKRIIIVLKVRNGGLLK
ncbi:MAG: hypothetical protein P4L49_09245 [Desulfosporosinus sp.]|nr:hypothetical protein [Desulfosporosinus sp.]